MTIYEEMKRMLWRRNSGDLKDKNAETKTVIKKIKRQYLNQTDKAQMSQELANIQSRIRSQLSKNPRTHRGCTWSLKDNSEYITEHLKLTCRFVMDKYPLT